MKRKPETPQERVIRLEKRISSLEHFYSIYYDEVEMANVASLKKDLEKIKKLLDK